MPELPEVEVTRRGIAGPLRGARVLYARLGKPLRWPLGCPTETLAGWHIGEVSRRGKYLWLPLSSAAASEPSAGAGAGTAANGTQGGLLLHLGMSGSLALLRDAPAPGPHDHFDLVTDRGTLRLNDPRRFGAVVWSLALHTPPASTLLRHLGPEPFDPLLTPEAFHARLQQRRAPIKAVLLAGDVVVGAGNIYACEALFQAGIHPALRADRISRPRAARLLAALRSTLARALDLGGSTLRDFTDVHGASGAYQAEAAVYGRAGQPCLRCGSLLRRRVQAQRSSYFCAICQRR
ncbi:MAG: bifunctional DNA-formamidopyrimidine glycosylase/DNA-(apurinic or apyrimidinic site) lyase [Betaproteobacteria bacterium]|nr:bifunctional DNA-formamidopyrimidine glycosylase/DNA-(apurinic or apyrimidinic site) lyase [Betaproteobacteria bacterium]